MTVYGGRRQRLDEQEEECPSCTTTPRLSTVLAVTNALQGPHTLARYTVLSRKSLFKVQFEEDHINPFIHLKADLR